MSHIGDIQRQQLVHAPGHREMWRTGAVHQYRLEAFPPGRLTHGQAGAIGLAFNSMEISPSSTDTVTSHHHTLMRAYLMVLRFLDNSPRIILLPLFQAPGILSLRVIPVSRFALRVFTLGHIKRVVEALDRAYRTRSVLDEHGSSDTDWTKLHDQAESMNAILHAPKLSRWIVAICGIALILLIEQTQSVESSLLFKLLVATVMLSPEKFVEVASEPGALSAFFRFVIVSFLLFTAVTPILIYHFRFQRALFNCPEIASRNGVGTVAIKAVWKQISVESNSLYGLEARVFTAFGDTAPREIPFDLIAIGVVYGYQAAGPGLLTGVLAYEVYQTNTQAGEQLFVVGTVIAAVGLYMVIRSMAAARRRAKLA